MKIQRTLLFHIHKTQSDVINVCISVIRVHVICAGSTKNGCYDIKSSLWIQLMFDQVIYLPVYEI